MFQKKLSLDYSISFPTLKIFVAKIKTHDQKSLSYLFLDNLIEQMWLNLRNEEESVTSN